MAQAIPSSLLVDDIRFYAKKIENNPLSPKMPNWVEELGNKVACYLAQVENTETRRHFFIWELRNWSQKIQDGQSGKLLTELVGRVKRAASYLDQTIRPPMRDCSHAEQRSEQYDWAFRENNREVLRTFSENLKELAEDQIDSLFGWALARWEVTVLHRMLKHTTLSSQLLDSFVEVAFQRKQFEKVAYPFMLHHFHLVSQEARDTIEAWIDEKSGAIYQQMASAFADLKTTLQDILSLEDFAAIPKMSSKEDLQPFIPSISALFRSIPPKEMRESRLQVALGLWNEFIILWPQNIELSELQEKLEEIIAVLRPPRSARFYDPEEEKEEKLNTRSIIQELRAAMKATDVSRAETLFIRSDFLQLSEKQIKALLHELFDYPKCFPALKSYLPLISRELHVDLIKYGITERKWEGVEFLANDLDPNALLDISEQFSNAPEDVQKKIQGMIDKSLAEPSFI